MNGLIYLLMYAISFMCPLVAYNARKELADSAKAGLILYGLAMMLFATVALFKGVDFTN